MVGEAPSRSLADPRQILVRKDLCELCGVSKARFVELYDRVNVLDEWPGKHPSGGDRFVMSEGVRGARQIMRDVGLRYDHIVLLGRRVERCFTMDPNPWFDQFSLEHFGCPANFYICPHPSRVSRWWNDPSNVTCAKIFWREMTNYAATLCQYH